MLLNTKLVAKAEIKDVRTPSVNNSFIQRKELEVPLVMRFDVQSDVVNKQNCEIKISNGFILSDDLDSQELDHIKSFILEELKIYYAILLNRRERLGVSSFSNIVEEVALDRVLNDNKSFVRILFKQTGKDTANTAMLYSNGNLDFGEYHETGDIRELCITDVIILLAKIRLILRLSDVSPF